MTAVAVAGGANIDDELVEVAVIADESITDQRAGPESTLGDSDVTQVPHEEPTRRSRDSRVVIRSSETPPYPHVFLRSSVAF